MCRAIEDEETDGGHEVETSHDPVKRSPATDTLAGDCTGTDRSETTPMVSMSDA